MDHVRLGQLLLFSFALPTTPNFLWVRYHQQVGTAAGELHILLRMYFSSTVCANLLDLRLGHRQHPELYEISSTIFSVERMDGYAPTTHIVMPQVVLEPQDNTWHSGD